VTKRGTFGGMEDSEEDATEASICSPASPEWSGRLGLVELLSATVGEEYSLVLPETPRLKGVVIEPSFMGK
jgi:hypothetical protein